MSNLPLRPLTTRQLKFCMCVSVCLNTHRCVCHVLKVTCECEVCLESDLLEGFSRVTKTQVWI